MRKTRTTIFVGIDEVNDKPTIQIEIEIEIIVGRIFRMSCNDCAAIIVIKQFPRTRNCVGTT